MWDTRKELMRCAVCLLVTLFLLMLIGCGTPRTPSQTVSRFYTLLGQGKFEAASRYLSAEAKLLFDFVMGMAEMLKQYAQETWGGVSITRVEILEERVQGNLAQVTYRLHFSDGTRGEVDRETLVREDGQWKIGLEF